jgi:hypothetical protein
MLKAVRNMTGESFSAQLRALYLARVNLHILYDAVGPVSAKKHNQCARDRLAGVQTSNAPLRSLIAHRLPVR